MGTFKEINGDLIVLAKQGQFDVITHGCNCFCSMGAGIAPQMAKAFGADEFSMEAKEYKGDINKLGTIDYKLLYEEDNGKWYEGINGKSAKYNKGVKTLRVVNSYTQYGLGRNHEGGEDIPLDYNALASCLKKINHIFKGKHIGLPQIGCGLAGGDWKIVKTMIKTYLKDMDVTVVIYKPN